MPEKNASNYRFKSGPVLTLDLWRLGQLYRVASFIGLAAVLILVSFLYQRFMTGRDEEEMSL